MILNLIATQRSRLYFSKTCHFVEQNSFIPITRDGLLGAETCMSVVASHPPHQSSGRISAVVGYICALKVSILMKQQEGVSGCVSKQGAPTRHWSSSVHSPGSIAGRGMMDLVNAHADTPQLCSRLGGVLAYSCIEPTTQVHDGDPASVYKPRAGWRKMAMEEERVTGLGALSLLLFSSQASQWVARKMHRRASRTGITSDVSRGPGVRCPAG